MTTANAPPAAGRDEADVTKAPLRRLFSGTLFWPMVVAPVVICVIVIAIVGIHHKQANSTNYNVSKPNGLHITASTSGLQPLGKAISTFLQTSAPGSGIYLEDLTAAPSAVSLQVQPNGAEYNAKSLMKLPLVMDLYKAVENGKLSLSDVETIQSSDIDKDYGNLWRQGVGYQLTLGTAASIAVRQSDNTAIKLINRVVYPALSFDERIYNVLHVDEHVTEDRDTYISPKAYSDFTRCLYTACYLTPADSQAMVGLLETTQFSAPSRMLPSTVQVAHKIGNVDQDGFNDCGIVYAPKHPFLFCYMLKEGEPKASQDVGQLTRWAYDYFTR